MSDSFGKSAAVEECESQQIAIYQSEDGSIHIEVQMQQESLWLTQRQLSSLFAKDVRTVNEHIHNILAEQELGREATIRKFRTTAADGKAFAIQSCVKQGKRIKTL
jgi:hypothetical protein